LLHGLKESSFFGLRDNNKIRLYMQAEPINDAEINKKSLICPVCKKELQDQAIDKVDICFECYNKSY